jgi:hypothetical protein
MMDIRNQSNNGIRGGKKDRIDKSMVNPHSIYTLLGMTHLLSSSILVPRLWVKDHLQRNTSIALKVPLIYVPMYNMCARSPKVYEANVISQNNETMVSNINHLGIVKIWGSYTPIYGNIKKSFSFMPYWNLGCLQKMV